MASIIPVKNGDGKITSYRISVYAGLKNGRKVHKTKTVKPTEKAPSKIKKELEKAAVEFENAVRNGTDFTDGSKIRFNELVKKWDENVLSVKASTGGITEACRERYLRMISLYGSKELNCMLLGKIKPANIDSTIKEMTDRKLKPKTIRNYFNALHQCFEYAVKNDLIPYNPCSKASALPQVKKKHELHTFSEEQAQRFLNEALNVDIPRSDAWKKLMDKVYFTTLLYSGFRKSELLALTWNDIDLTEASITINKTVGYNDSDKEFIKPPKTESGKRKITLPAICFHLLSEWKNTAMELCMKAGKGWKGYRGSSFDKNYIFIRADGTRMSLYEPYKHFIHILEEYNKTVPENMQLPMIRLHDLRHTCASHLVAAGTDIETVARRLGHSRASFTLDIYAEALIEKDKGASDTLEQIFTAKQI